MKRNRFFILFIIATFVLIFLSKVAIIYTDLLWFKAVKYGSVFWTLLFSKIFIFFAFMLFCLIVFWINLYISRFSRPNRGNWKIPIRRQDFIHIVEIQPKQVNWLILVISVLISGVMGFWASFGNWDAILKFLYQVPFNKVDPIFNKDIGFFVFSYPVLSFIQQWLFGVIAICLVCCGLIYIKDQAINLKIGDFRFDRAAKTHLSTLCAILLILVAWNKRLKMFGLLYSPRGVAFGASYTDMHAQMVAYWALLVIAAACAILFWINITSKGWKLPLIGIAIMIVISILISGIYPNLIQRFIVVPNELKKETPYIKYNIKYTRQGYNLNTIEERDFITSDTLTRQDFVENSSTIKNIKLWDKKPLKQTYAQMQELRPYYKFINIDEDRYLIDGTYTQVMISGRELVQGQLPEEAKTWENQHFKYTHGYGLCLSPVNHVTEKGLPAMVVRDIPPISNSDLKISRPEIYYGESTSNYVIVNNKSGEFNYPKGDKNVYSDYDGKGGVAIGSFLNRILFSIRFNDPKIFLTGYVKPESRIMFYRQISNRVNMIAPFLMFDKDPYLVLGDGRLYWIQDAYTVTDKYPYSEPYYFQLVPDENIFINDPIMSLKAKRGFFRRHINYIRNSIKIVIDAYNGSPDFYISDIDDPIVKTYQKIFPGLFKEFSEMPDFLKAHIRYPRDLFNAQTHMYATYHMQDPQVFYNKEDLWVAPLKISEQADNNNYSSSESFGMNELMKPYYVTLKMEGEEKEEFLIMLPFTPFGEKKNNMIAWMCARCDTTEYGKLLVYKFLKDKLIYGPRQIEARIDQQTEISSELTLWSQRGSKVFRGELLVIPVKRTLIYVEPIYLMASQDELPELKRVIVAYGDSVEMRETLDEALRAVFLKEQGEGALDIDHSTASREGFFEKKSTAPESISDLIFKANELFQQAIEHQKAGEWAEYGESLRKLEYTLRDLTSTSTGHEEDVFKEQ